MPAMSLLLLAAVLFAPVASVATEQPTTILAMAGLARLTDRLPGTRFLGASTTTGATSAAECDISCLTDLTCLAWTWNAPSTCAAFSGSTFPTSNAAYFSGNNVLAHIYVALPLVEHSQQTASAKRCASLALELAFSFWTWDVTTQDCALGTGPLQSNPTLNTVGGSAASATQLLETPLRRGYFAVESAASNDTAAECIALGADPPIFSSPEELVAAVSIVETGLLFLGVDGIQAPCSSWVWGDAFSPLSDCVGNHLFLSSVPGVVNGASLATNGTTLFLGAPQVGDALVCSKLVCEDWQYEFSPGVCKPLASCTADQFLPMLPTSSQWNCTFATGMDSYCFFTSDNSCSNTTDCSAIEENLTTHCAVATESSPRATPLPADKLLLACPVGQTISSLTSIRLGTFNMSVSQNSTCPNASSVSQICALPTTRIETHFLSDCVHRSKCLLSIQRDPLDIPDCPALASQAANVVLTFTCADRSYTATAATASSDNVCSMCTPCQASEIEAAVCTGEHDTTCALCQSSEFANVNGTCDPLTKCQGNEFELTAPTPTSDRVCQAATLCAPFKIRTAPASDTSDAVCEPALECLFTQVETAPPTPTSQRVCAFVSGAVSARLDSTMRRVRESIALPSLRDETFTGSFELTLTSQDSASPDNSPFSPFYGGLVAASNSTLYGMVLMDDAVVVRAGPIPLNITWRANFGLLQGHPLQIHYHHSHTPEGALPFVQFPGSSDTGHDVSFDGTMCSASESSFSVQLSSAQPTSLELQLAISSAPLEKPTLSALPDSITINALTPADTVLLQLAATARCSISVAFGIATQSLGTYFSVNSVTGAVTVSQPLPFQSVSITIDVTAAEDTALCTLHPMSCTAHKLIRIDIVAISCPHPIFEPASDLELLVSWTPASYIDIPNDWNKQSLPDLGNASYPSSSGIFALGKHQVALGEVLSSGQELGCLLSINILRGVQQETSVISAYRESSNTAIQYFLDSKNHFGTSPRLDTLSLDAAPGREVLFKLQPPRDLAFAISRPATDSTVGLSVLMTWCVDGTIPANSTWVAATTHLNLTPLTNISFVSGPLSGYTSDGRCLRFDASIIPVLHDLEFDHIDVYFPVPIEAAAHLQSRRRSLLGSNETVSFQSVGWSRVFGVVSSPSQDFEQLDSASFAFIRDRQPPLFTNCPNDIVVYLPLGAAEEIVHWSEPTASDNSGAPMVYSNFQPGQVFSASNSPHHVVYQAFDIHGLRSVCKFNVLVTFEELASNHSFPSNYRDDFAAQGPLNVEHTQLYEVSTYKDFLWHSAQIGGGVAYPDVSDRTIEVDLSNTTQIRITVLPPHGQRFALQFREAPDSVSFDIDVVLTCSLPSCANLDIVNFVSNVSAFATVDLLDAKWANETDLELPADWFKGNSVNNRLHFVPGSEIIRIQGSTFGFLFDGFHFGGIEMVLNFPEGVVHAPVNMTIHESSFIQMAYLYLDPVTGSSANASARVNHLQYLDIEAPYFTVCPTSMVLPTLPRLNVARATWAEPQAQDNVELVRVTASLAQGTLLPIGTTTTVRYEAFDNFANSAVCSFNITVQDQEAPTLECPSQRNFSVSTSSSTVAFANWTDFGVACTDNSGHVVFGGYPSELAIGRSHLIVKVRDLSGNQASCNLIVDVIDAHPPVFVDCPSLPYVAVAAEGQRELVFDWPRPTATDNDKIAGVNVSRTSNVFPVGKNSTITLTAWDPSGNSAQCVVVVAARSLSTARVTTAATSITMSIISSLLVIVLLAIVYAIFWFKRRRQLAMDRVKHKEIVDKYIGLAQSKFDFSNIVTPDELSRSNIKLLARLEKGNFGEVHKALLSERNKFGRIVSRVVAVKKLLGQDEEHIAEFLDETAIMAQFQHERVVQLIGVVIKDAPMLMVIEYCEFGSLKSQLEKKSFSLLEKVIFAEDCAEGLAYMHSIGVLHRDIAARNVLLGPDRRCKIADFGMSRDSEVYYATPSSQVPLRWTAPEGLKDKRRFSTKSDVWSFGVLLFEIWSDATLPYAAWTSEQVFMNFQQDEGQRLARPTGCPCSVYALMLSAWHSEPTMRPDMRQFFEAFQEMHVKDSLLQSAINVEKIMLPPPDYVELLQLAADVAGNNDPALETARSTLRLSHANASTEYSRPNSEAGSSENCSVVSTEYHSWASQTSAAASSTQYAVLAQLAPPAFATTDRPSRSAQASQQHAHAADPGILHPDQDCARLSTSLPAEHSYGSKHCALLHTPTASNLSSARSSIADARPGARLSSARSSPRGSAIRSRGVSVCPSPRDSLGSCYSYTPAPTMQFYAAEASEGSSSEGAKDTGYIVCE
eukprot:m.112442 g.112442  ORF g.112442 m.112442 type:complete len:2312 (-) comp9396_c0_seq4:186-7121(-)